MKLIEMNMDKIIALCHKFRVKSLSVFGSILTDPFSEQSDVDFLVNFDTTDHEQWDYVSNYFGFRDALEALFNRKIDLIEEQGIRNPLFLAAINKHKMPIYG